MTDELKQVSVESEAVVDIEVVDSAEIDTAEATAIEGSAGSASVAGQAARVISPPPAGQTDVIRLAPGERFELAANPATVNLVVDGDNLVLGFDLDGNGTPDSFVVLEDLVLAAGGGNPPVLMVAGEPIGVDLLIGNAQAIAQTDQGGPGAPLETAAGGDTGPQGGGVAEYSDNLGDAIDLLVAQGVIPPVQLEFGLIELENEDFIVEEEDTPPETPPPGVPDTTFSFDETPGSGLSGLPFTGDGTVDGDEQGRGDIDGTTLVGSAFSSTGPGVPNELGGFLYIPFLNAMSSGSFGLDAFVNLSGSGLHQVAVSGATSAELQYSTGAPVLTSGGNPATSQGEQIYYLVDPTNPNLVLGVTGLVVFGEREFEYDNLVFAIHLDDAFFFSGDNLAFTYAEYQQIDHPDTSGHDESIALTINFDVTGPGGTTSAKVTLLVEDDGPNADGGEGYSDDMLVYDETPGMQTGEETSDPLPAGLDAVVSNLLQVEEIEGVCGAARDTIFFDYGMDQPVDGGEGSLIGGVALTQADGSLYNGEDSGLDTLSGEDILLFSDGGNVVYGKTAGGAFVFAVYLDDSNAFSFSGPDNGASAEIWFVQFQPFFHADSSDANDEIQFSVHYTVTDFDQDTSTQEFIIKILDDGPSLNEYGGPSVGVVEEEHLPLGNEDEGDHLGLDGDSGGDFGITTTTAAGDLSVLVDPGKDAPALFGLAADTTPLEDQNLTSGGQPLSYAVSGGVLVAFIGADETDESNWVFTLDLQADGSWTFELLGKLDHHDISDADDVEDILTIDFTGMVEATDSDLDPVTLDPESFLVKVIDDIPTANDDEDDAEVGGDPVSGNVIAGVSSDADSPGADGLGVIRSITHDGVTYELNGAGDGISDGSDVSPTDGDDLTNFGFVFDPLTGVLTINTAEGGTFDITMTGSGIGDYTYSPPNAVSGTSEAFVYVLEDGDGDGAPATLTISLNDEPDAGLDQALTIDETPGHENEGASDISDDVDPATLTLNASTTTALSSLGLATDLSDCLSVAQKDSISFSYGANGKGLTGGISFDDPAGADSSLVDTATGEPIFLYLVDGLIVGRVGSGGVADESGDIAFVMILEENGTPGENTVDSSAEFLVVSYRAVEHDNPDDHDEENPESGFNDETVTVTFTVEDADGDKDSADITVSFEDDGPDAVDDPAVSVTEGDSEVSGNVLANDDPGSDGGLMTHVRLPGGNFVAIDSGTEVAGGEYQFAVTGIGTYTFKADGNWTFTPEASVDNSSGDVDASFDYRLSDGDGDTDEATQPISIEDGADPTAGGPLSLSVDEDDLPGGTDQQPEPGGDRIDGGTLGFTAGSDDLTSFAFSTDLSNLEVDVDGVAGDDVIWVRNSDTEIVGKIGGIDAIRLTLTAPASIAAGAADTVTVKAELLEAFPHPDAAGQNIINLGSVNVVATDSDGDDVEGTVNVQVVDDVPTDIAPDKAVIGSGAGSTTSGDLDFYDNVGADKSGDVTFASSLNDAQLLQADGSTAVTSNGFNIYTQVSGDGHTLTAYADVDGSGTVNEGDTVVFTVELSPNSEDEGADKYAITMFEQIDTGDQIGFDDFSGLGGGNNVFFPLQASSGSGASHDLLITGKLPGTNTVNTDSDDVGTGNQWVGAGQLIRLDYVTDVSGTPSDLSTLSYTDHYVVNDAGFRVNELQGNTLSVSVLVSVFDQDENPQGSDFTTEGVGDPLERDRITSARIEAGGLVYTAAYGGMIFNGTDNVFTDGPITFTFNSDGTIKIDGLVAGDQVFVSSDNGFTQMEIENVSSGNNPGMSLDNFLLSTGQSGEPIDLSFDLQVTDEDGDTASGTLDVTVLPQQVAGDDGETLTATEFGSDLVGGAGDDTLIGSDADDKLQGRGGDDVISDGAGNDIIIGGDGADFINLANDGDTDVLVYNALSEAGDVVTGFDTDAPVLGGSGGDIIDLAGLLDGGSFTGTTLAEAEAGGYVDLLQDGLNVAVRVDINGGSDFSTTVVTINNVTVADLADNIVVD